MKKKAVFLDRDGVINREIGDYICRIDDFTINNGVGEAISLLKNNNFLVIIISNQAGIAKLLYTSNDVEMMHQKLVNYLTTFGTSVDEFYYCPHHDSITNCLCRKPKSLMLEKAIARFCIDASKSFFIGDSQRDIEAAKSAGVTGILTDPNSSILKLCEQIISKTTSK